MIKEKSTFVDKMEKKKPGPPVHIAIAFGPTNDTDYIKRTFDENGLKIPAGIREYQDWFYIMLTKEPNYKFLSLNGRTKLIFSTVDLNSWLEIVGILDNNFEKRIYGNTLDLSFITDYANFDIPHNASFAMFVSGLYCIRNKIVIENIRFLNYGENPKKDVFRNVKYYFPFLKRLYVNQQMNTNEIEEVIFKQGVELIKTDNVDFIQNFIKKEKLPNVPDILMIGSNVAFNDYPVEVLDERLYLKSSFIGKFLEYSWKDINQLSEFYNDTSIFSVLIDSHGPYSNLEYFDNFSHNYLRPLRDNQLVGKNLIIQGQMELFDGHFFSKPSKYYIKNLSQFIETVIINGIFLFHDYVFGFTRTLILQSTNDGVIISNDNIFIKEERNT